MKNLILGIFILITGNQTNAQEIFMTPGNTITELQAGAYYRLSPEDAKKFTGIWISPNQNFKILISTEKKFLEGPNIYMEKLTGKYCLNEQNCIFEAKEINLSVGSILFEDGVSAEFILQDQIKNKLGNAKLELIDENRAKWTVSNRETITFNKEKSDYNFSVPTEVILTKVK